MTETEQEAVLATVRKLWPRMQWSPDEWNLLADKIGRFDADACEAVIREVKATDSKASRTPSLAALVTACRNAANQAARCEATAKPAALRDQYAPAVAEPPDLSWLEWAEWTLRNNPPVDPIHAADIGGIARGMESCFSSVNILMRRGAAGLGAVVKSATAAKGGS